MYWLVEDEEKINILTRMQIKEAYLEIIPTSHTLHPVENNVSCVYVKPIDKSKGYMVSVNHSEAFCIEIELVYNLINSIEKLYVVDKKEFLHYFFHPINSFYNNKTTVVFNAIEKNGLKVNPTLYKQYFDRDVEEYVYTQYKLNTTTTRPSNKFGGINFASLNKDTNERECFVPNNDFLLEMDISAYHPTLLAHRIHYDFSSSDVHGDFAEMYGVDYGKAKEITFKQLYGGIWKEYEHLEFFQKVIQFKIWKLQQMFVYFGKFLNY